MLREILIIINQGRLEVHFFYSKECNQIHSTWPQGYKTFFILNSAERDEISTAHKTKTPTNKVVYCFKSLRYITFIMLINVKCQQSLAL